MQIDGKRNLLFIHGFPRDDGICLFRPSKPLDKQPEEVQFTEYVESSGAVVCLAE